MSAPSRLAEPRLFRQQCLVAGNWIDASNGATIEVDNPASGEIIGSVPSLSEAQLNDCIAQADKAYASWRRTTALTSPA